MLEILKKNRHVFLSFPILFSLISFLHGKSFAFDENYPPFDVKTWSGRMLNASPVNTTDNGEFRDKDIVITWVTKVMESSAISIQYKSKSVAQIDLPGDDEWSSFLGEIYYVDLDSNGLPDIIIHPSNFGSGLGAFKKTTTIYFQTASGQFRRLNITSFNFDPKDFVDLKGDGTYALLIMQLAQIECADGKLHSFWTYVPYEVKDFNLVMNPGLHPDYPRFIWYTEEPNSKPTDKLSNEQKSAFLKTLPAVIRSEAL